MPQTYKEQDFEDHIESRIVSSGYINKTTIDYDKYLCLIPEETLHFLKSTQLKEYQKLTKQYGTNTDQKLTENLAKRIGEKGSLNILRKGFKDRGSKFKLAYFKPSSGMNPEHLELYKKNRFATIRQLKYSKKNESSIDLVLFFNGIPIVTLELKNTLTGQTVENAKKQYKEDRDWREPLLQYKRCVVHFAVDDLKVFMTTKLLGSKTYFLPFNKDTENPINPNGHSTAYLWEDILHPDTLLDLINNYLHEQINTEKYYDNDKKEVVEKTYETLVFPRYHQLDVVRKMLTAVKKEGVGNNYLVQHSAGSGKSNSIAWLSHQLASFYQKETDKERMFDSIIVVTDRKILDKQLRDTIKQFEQTAGVVCAITQGSKELKTALEQGKDIIVTTLQKFPFISETMADLKGHKFAVIIDEAHSSQSGESSKHLKKVLSVNLENAEKEDTDDFSLEDKITEEIRYRGKQPHISYFAFTATPKNKTLELFGRKNPEDVFTAFHIYSMRQAIEEKFILDVLRNYTTCKRYFNLTKKVEEDKEYEKKKAIKQLTSYVDLLPHAIEMKAKIMLDHFLEKTVNSIQGKARAMVVTRSRLHAVRFYLTLKKLLAEKGIEYKPLVAFSGKVKDPDTLDENTENSLNRLPAKVDIKDAFKTPEYRILVAANKFQTGFDEPYLHTMYVDKRLDGVNAVQTLSRLNRTKKGKSNTVIIDFVNEVEDIIESFQPYYQTTILEGETEPNRLYEIESKLKEYDIYVDEDIEDFSGIYFNPKEPDEKYQPILNRVVQRFNEIEDSTEREDCRSTVQSFIRIYSFISQLITFEDIDLEKLYVFLINLNRKLPKRKISKIADLEDSVDLDSIRIQKTFEGTLKPVEKDGYVNPLSETSSPHPEDEKDFLSNIIKTINEVYGFDATKEEKDDIENIMEKVRSDEELQSVMEGNNSRESMKYKFEKTVDEIILSFVNTKLDLYNKLTDNKINKYIKETFFETYLRQLRKDRVS